jgi:hypothetical protein
LLFCTEEISQLMEALLNMTDGDATRINELISQAKLKLSTYQAGQAHLVSGAGSVGRGRGALQPRLEAPPPPPPQHGVPCPTADDEIPPERTHFRDMDRIWLGATSRSCSTDLASIRWLARRIRQDQLSAPTKRQGYARVRPSQVMRPTSIASSDFRLFGGAVESLSSAAAELDSIV